MAGGLGDVAGAGLALGADHGRALADPTQRLTEVGGSAYERDGEAVLIDVVGVVGRRKHLGFVDEIDLQLLKDLSLDEVPNTGLGHDRDGHRLNDLRDEIGIAHTGDSALRADISGHAFKRHDGDGAGVLCDAGLLGRHDIHDDAALEHVGQSAFNEWGSGGRGLGGFRALSALSALSGLNTIGHEHDAAPGSGLP